MQVFIFYSEKDADVVAFTEDQAGENLPTEFAPWSPLGGRVIQIEDNLVGISGKMNAVIEGITRDGFFLASAETRITHFPSPRNRKP